MSVIWRVLRFFGLWVLPPIVVLAGLLAGFAWWTISSQAGSRWLLHTVISQLDGHVTGIYGNVWDGLRIDELVLDLPEIDVQAEDLRLQVAWRELLQRNLRVHELSADRLVLNLPQGDAGDDDDEPLALPALPVSVQLDRLAVNDLQLNLAGTAVPVHDLSFVVALQLQADEASAQVEQAHVAHEDMVFDWHGQVKLQQLAAPWSFMAKLQGQARQQAEKAMLCLRPLLASFDSHARSDQSDCEVNFVVQAEGSLQQLDIQGHARGTGLALDLNARVYPEQPFPLGKAELELLVDPAAKPAVAAYRQAAADQETADLSSASAHDKEIQRSDSSAVSLHDADSATGSSGGTATEKNARKKTTTATTSGHTVVLAAAPEPVIAEPPASAAAASSTAMRLSLLLQPVFTQRAADEADNAPRQHPAQAEDEPVALHLEYALSGLALGPWLAPDLGNSLLNLQGDLLAGLDGGHGLKDLSLNLEFGEGTRWNDQALSGHLRLARLARSDGQNLWPPAPAAAIEASANKTTTNEPAPSHGATKDVITDGLVRDSSATDRTEKNQRIIDRTKKGQSTPDTIAGNGDPATNGAAQENGNTAESDDADGNGGVAAGSDPAANRIAQKNGNAAANDDAAGNGDAAVELLPAELLALQLQGLDVNLALGNGKLLLQGDLAGHASQLAMELHLPALAAVWPGLPGALDSRLQVDGAFAQHRLQLSAEYRPDDLQPDTPGKSAMAVQAGLAGAWHSGTGWQAQLTSLELDHAGLHVNTLGPWPLSLKPDGEWQAGAVDLAVILQDQELFQIRHLASSGQGAHWSSKGQVDSLVLSAERIARVQQWLGLLDEAGRVRGVFASQAASESRLETRLDWDFGFADVPQGKLTWQYLSGDLIIPGEEPVALGMQSSNLQIELRPSGEHSSQLMADLVVETRDMGRLHVQAETPLRVLESGGIDVLASDTKRVRIQADSEDIAWVNLWLDGSLEVGGTLHADISGTSRPDGLWTLNGPLTGEKIRILDMDQGIRLLDGTLEAHAEGTRLVLDHLRFPALRRVTPKEWRTATWIEEEPDAQNGYLDLGGQWDLLASEGMVQADFHRYPILQRSDRYAMMTGNIQVVATLPEILIEGKLVADAGWFDLDVLHTVPSLDGDVLILDASGPEDVPAGAEPEEPEVPLDVHAMVTIDLGPRFYLTGFGVNSGLVGSMDLTLRNGQLTALGALRTRGGSIDAYGQHLQLRQGTITFQGDVTNPVLSIEALRTDVAVQAGVRVAGTARHPRIGLVSYPDVSETEKLTWLLLGHGPDEGGGDISLLFSVGSSFLMEGEPFYKRFGLDELSMRSGELGSAGSILPVESVVSGLDTGASQIEQRFVRAGKTLSRNFKIGLEQALAQTGTVARLSYRLMRGLNAELTLGTVNGLALVYRWFSRNPSNRRNH